MKKNFNKLATLALSGMMVMSMAMPAFAAPPVIEGPNKFVKRLHMDGETYAPNTTFEFNVDIIKTNKITILEKEYDNLVADDGALKLGTATFNKGLGLGTDFEMKDGKIVGSKLDVEVPITVDATKLNNGYGNYYFKVKEIVPADAAKYEGIRYSEGTYYIVLMKYNDNGTDKVKVIMQREDKFKDMVTKVDYIQNNYGKHNPPETPDFPDPKPDPSKPKPDPDPKNDTTHDVVITKNIGGKTGNKTDKFKFKVLVESQKNAGERYKVLKVVTDTDGNRQWSKSTTPADADYIQATDGSVVKFVDDREESKEFEVTQGTGIRISGLTAGDKITVIEGDNLYTMDVDANNQLKAKKTFVENLAMVTKPNGEKEKFKASFTTVKDEADVVVTNTKGITVPTGIVMNVAPYALMLAVAGGMGVVFVNRKKEEE